MKKLLLLIFVTLFFNTCSLYYSITYNTKPSGATIICNGVEMGFSPLMLEYDTDNIDERGSCIH